MTKKKVYPSQEKYNEENPVISIRLTKRMKDILDREKGNLDLTYPQVMKKLLSELTERIERISFLEKEIESKDDKIKKQEESIKYQYEENQKLIESGNVVLAINSRMSSFISENHPEIDMKIFIYGDGKHD